MKQTLLLLLLLLGCVPLHAQINITLYEQFNGRYDFTFTGNTLNSHANGTNMPCEIKTSSSAGLNLQDGNTILKAFLYWAGSGEGDYNIKLNGIDIAATRKFPVIATTTDLTPRPYFSAFADVTTIVQSIGNGTYTVSELDLTSIINNSTPPSENLYCMNGTNFGGWAIVVVYENPDLPLNQLNLYDGLQYVPSAITITLPSLNVIDNEGAKIGFVAWEGDANIWVNETLRINGNVLGNPPLNPPDNAFNCTNSVTGSNTLYNMDLDIYNIQNFINIGDDNAEIQLTSGQDFVMVNTIITKLNSQLPDATITVENISQQCGLRTMQVNYTVYNKNSTDVLPAGTPVSIYLGDILLDITETREDIAIGGSETGNISITIPEDAPADFELTFVADDIGNGTGIVVETDETNNTFILPVTLLSAPEIAQPDDITACDEGFGQGTFDFSAYSESLKNAPGDIISFHSTQQDAESGLNPIYNNIGFITNTNSQRIYVRLNDGTCYGTTSFLLITKKCAPTTYNYITPNGDTYNDTFFVKGLRNIFLNFKMKIYNRWGNLIWTGDHSMPDWDGIASEEKIGPDDNTVPNSTYYFVLELNDPDFPEPITGWVYVTR